jgi:DNA-binding LacI/PurR family transcriptional regulator
MKKNKRYASSTDVARLAGVSQSAVSRAFQQGGSVSEETRQKVLTAAATLDYRPSLIPRIMLTHRSNLVAIVIGGLYNPFYASVLEVFTARLQQAGNQVLLVHVDSGYSLDSAIPRLASYRVDAIVSALAILTQQAADELAKLRVPIVSFNTSIQNEWVSSVSCDNIDAGRRVADLFIERGATRFGYMAGPLSSPASEERLYGYRQRLGERGITGLRTAHGDFRYEGGQHALAELMSHGEPPDALFCANDLLAMGAMDSLRKDFGLQVPRDMMVAGFDDIAPAAWSAYDLTTSVQDAPAMVDAAIAIIAEMTETGGRTSGTRTIPARLVERGSTQRGPTQRKAEPPPARQNRKATTK